MESLVQGALMRHVMTRVAATASAFAAAGVAATLMNKASQQRRRELRRGDVEFGSVRGESRYLTAADDSAIHVEIDEGPEPVIIFVHGWMCDIDTWHFQRLALRGRHRLIFMDLRSHGKSAKTTAANSSLDDLSMDLEQLIDHYAPDSPIVLVGHSMGGMTIMRHAHRWPHRYGDQIQGVVLIGTSSGGLLGNSPGLRHVAAMMRAARPLLDWGREFNSFSVIRRWAVGPDAPEQAIDLANEMILRAPSSVIADFYANFLDLDLTEGLPELSRCRTSVVCGTKDVLTPWKHSVVLAEAIDGAELVPVAGAGHMVMFEEPEQITEVIERVLGDIE